MEKISEAKKPRINNKSRWHKSKMGYEFNYFGEVWDLDGSYSINLSNLRPLDKRTEKGARETFCRYAEEMSAGTTSQTFNLFNYFLDETRLTSITTAGITNWLAELSSGEEHKLGALRVLFYHWHDWGFEGVDKDVVKFLDELVLRGAESGVAVKKACQYTGPLTHVELGAILEWASNQYVKSKLSITEYSYLLILALTGRRTINIRSLRAKDLLVRKHAKVEEYIVNFPRAKQKHTQFRSQFTPVNVNKELYLVMSAQIKKSTSAIEYAIGTELPENLRKETPIFINQLRIKDLKSAECFEKTIRERPDYLHLGKWQATTMMDKIKKKCTAKSERTGDFIHLTSHRFRYTKATNLARKGIRGVALAAALDHTNTEHIGVYTENTEEVAEQITELMAPVLAPLAQAFAGTLVNSERDAVRGNDPNSRIKNKDHHNIGSCGTYAFCVGGYRSCYTCINFQPWLEAPHQEVLEEVLQERQRQEDVGISADVISSTDRLLLAVQQVVDICAEHKAKSECL